MLPVSLKKTKMKWDSSICRVCLKSSPENVDLRVKVESENDGSYLDLFNTCTNLEANCDDDLPLSICCSCTNDLFISFQFLNRAISSDNYLRSKLNDKSEYYLELEEEHENKYEDESAVLQESHLNGVDANYADEVSLDDKELNLSAEQTFEIVSCNSPSYYDDNDLLSEEYEIKHENTTETKLTIECVSNEEFERVIRKNDLESNDNNVVHSFQGTKENSIHKGKETTACSICGKMLKRWSMKHHHDRCHRKDKLYLCSACPKTFTIQSDLKIHMKIHDNTRERSFFCTVCRKGFFEKQALGVHMRRHSGVKQYQCEICSKKFTTKQSLEVHEFTHNRESGRFVCKYCDKRFSSNTDLIVHERFHTGDYPYKCELCDKSYAVKSHYNYHMGKHKGVTYKCDECDKEFINRGSLTAHKYKHCDRMPHECRICGKGFASLFKLNRHQNSHKLKISVVSIE